MKFCQNCGTQLDENMNCCPNCGAPTIVPAPVIMADPDDHTLEFDPKDISENKVTAMLPYLMGVIGVIVAAILAADSPYARFHVKNSLKFDICTIISCIAFIIPILGWIVGGVAMLIIFVLRVIAFFQVCSGKAKDPAIIGKFGFLK